MIPLEDNFADILAKAMRGRGLSPHAAARAAGLAPAQVESLLAGSFDGDSLRGLAQALRLAPAALARIAKAEYAPEAPAPRWLAQITTRFGGMTVNAYVVWDHLSLGAAIFDTGADADPILDLVSREKLKVVGIFLTHSHADHVHALAELKRELGVDAWSSEFEPVRGTSAFRPGDVFSAGHHFVRTRLTPGHSPGGTTFLIEGPAGRAAIVGDALFAGSVGGISKNYEASLDTIRREILELPGETILCPGHGPMTTVAQETANNPFFAQD